jgi:hypothetical protein
VKQPHPRSDRGYPIKWLLTISAAIEAGAGVAFAIAPHWVARLLLGSPLDSPAGLVVGRVLGAALLALATACWLARDDARGQAATGLTAAMLLYNVAAVGVLSYARIRLGTSGVGLIPVIVLHAAMGAWCGACLRNARRDRSA